MSGRANGNVQGTCHIICGAPGDEVTLERCANDLVIAADGGYRACEQAGIAPDVLIGDFDSLGMEAALQAGSHERVHEVIMLPTAKDDTDTLAAIREGLARGYRRFELHAALGGDVGHEFANLQSLLFIRRHGAEGCLHGNGQTVWLVMPEDGTCLFPVEAGMRVSVFAFGGDARGVNERGLRWELSDAELSCAFPLGVSNECLRDDFEVSVREGCLLVVVG